jgi:BTB/POZ domain
MNGIMDRAPGNSKDGDNSSWSFHDIGSASSGMPGEQPESDRSENELMTSQLSAPLHDSRASVLRYSSQTPTSFDFSRDLPPLSSRPGQPRRTASTNNVQPFPGPESTTFPTIFDPPHRSIFTSGPPTASVSSNTAQASMSAASPSGSSRPLAALSGATASRRNTPRSMDLPSQFSSLLSPTRQSLTVPEKDVDDPSENTLATGPDVVEVDTSTTLSKLFAVSGSASPMPSSRDISHLRSFSGAVPVIESTSTLAGHLLHRGFIDGRHSDITVYAFGQSYRLHKLMLDRVPFFSSAFSGSWAESSASEMTLHPEDIDSNITKNAFELALKRVYGAQLPLQEESEALGLFATSCWLDMPDLVDSSVDSILRQMHPSKLDVLIKLVTSNYYGKAGDRILASAKAMLCREGWEMPYRYWDRLPAEIVREIIGGNPFYVPGEWERWFLALKLLNRRLKQKAIQAGLVSPAGRYLHPKPNTLNFFAVRFDRTYRRDASFESGRHIAEKDEPWVALYTSPDIAPVLVLLDEGIHYAHLRFEQLQQMRAQRDILGVPVLPEKVLSDALWMSMELRQRVVNAHESDLELGLSEVAGDYDDEELSEAQLPAHSNGKGKNREALETDIVEMESGSWDGNGKPRKFWIPGSDVSYVMGGSREASIAANMSGGAEWASHTSRLSASLEPSDVAWAADFSGTADYSIPITKNMASKQPPRFSHYPPFRFSAEFPNPRTLKEKKRVYSQTVWYAGSMWNLYCQRVNTSKNPQLGIYLHRAKDKDPSDDPLAQFTPSNVDDRIGQLERQMLLRKSERRSRNLRPDINSSGGEVDREDASSGSGNEEQAPSTVDIERWRESRAQKTTQTPSMSPSKALVKREDSIMTSDDEHDDLFQASRRFSAPTLPPYVDGRPTIKTYFKIYSPSKNGRMLSIYESAPDRFNFSQSWGWKSSQMVLDDGVSAATELSGGRSNKDGGKLRYMVVIGNV